MDKLKEALEGLDRRARDCRQMARDDGTGENACYRLSAKASAYEHSAELIREALSRAPAVGDDKWRPMDSAPRDGTFVDLWGSYGFGPPFRQAGFAWTNGRWLDEDEEDASDYPKYIFQPTHWMSLPAAPKES